MLPTAALLLFLASYVLTAALLPWIERVARRTGYVDRPDARKDHRGVVAYGGGLAVVAAVAIPALLGAAAAFADLKLAPEVREHFAGVRAQAPKLVAILAGAGLMLALGYADDRRRLSPRIRLLAQAAAGLGLYALGIRVTLYMPWPAAQAAATVLFVVFAMNAHNFIDNMNGALAGVAAVEAACLLALALDTGQLFLAATTLCLLAALLAFLPRNFPEAKVFLGDAGSLPLGFLFAALTVQFKFGGPALSPRPFLVPPLLLAVPLADGLTVVLSRLRRGVHPFTAGHDHLAHRLAARGLSRPRAAATLWAAALLCGLAALAIAGVSPLAVGATVFPVALVLWRSARKAL